MKKIDDIRRAIRNCIFSIQQQLFLCTRS